MANEILNLTIDSPKTTSQQMGVTATVSRGGQVVNSGTVKFTILSGSAMFSDSQGNATSSITQTLGSTGEATVYASSQGGTTGQIKAELVSSPNINDTEPYTFIQATSGFTLSPLYVDDSNSFADGTSKAYASVYVYKGNVPQVNATVQFYIGPDSKALFVDNKEQLILSPTGSDGKASVAFTDKFAEVGQITASLVNNPLVDEKSHTFQFLQIPSITFVDPTVNAQPADGLNHDTITVFVSYDDNGQTMPMANISVVLNLPDWAYFDQATMNNTQTVLTNGDGKCTVPFYSNTVGVGNIEANILNNPKYNASKQFSFSTAWQNVSNYSISFEGTTSGDDTVYLFQNNRHKAILNIQFELLDASNNILTDEQTPTPQYVQDNVTLIDFVSTTELGTGDYSAFKISTSSGDFAINAIPHQSAPNRMSFDTCTIKNGVAYLTYYISCDETFDNATKPFIQIGSKITPTGDENSKLIYDSKNGFFKSSAKLTLVDEFNYNTNIVKTPGQYIAHNNTNDYGPAAVGSQNSGDNPDNYWRQFNFNIELDLTLANSPIENCNPKIWKWCFASEDDRKALLANTQNDMNSVFATTRFGGLYGMKAYFWPMNVYDENQNPIISPPKEEYDFKLTYSDCQSQNISFNSIGNNVYMTLYCTFGSMSPDQILNKPINFIMYDQYGNTGNFHLNTALPNKYSINELKQFNFLNDGNISLNIVSKPGIQFTNACIWGNPLSVVNGQANYGPIAKLGVADSSINIPSDLGTNILILEKGIPWYFTKNDEQQTCEYQKYTFNSSVSQYISQGKQKSKLLQLNYINAIWWYITPVWNLGAMLIMDPLKNVWCGSCIQGSNIPPSGYPCLSTQSLVVYGNDIQESQLFYFDPQYGE